MEGSQRSVIFCVSLQHVVSRYNQNEADALSVGLFWYFQCVSNIHEKIIRAGFAELILQVSEK